MGGAMEDALLGDEHILRGAHFREHPGVQIATEAREVAAADLQPDPVSGLEGVSRLHQLDGELRDFPRGQPVCVATVAIPGTQSSLGHVGRVAVWFNVDELGREVGVPRATGSEQPDEDLAGYPDWCIECVGGVARRPGPRPRPDPAPRRVPGRGQGRR